MLTSTLPTPNTPSTPDAYLDTNLIIRYLTKDNPDQSQRAKRLFEQVEQGATTLTTCEGVIIEAVNVFSSKVLYNLPRTEVRAHLTNILSLKALKIAHKSSYLRALDLYATTNLDFVDALIVAHMERTKMTTLMSFDRDFDKVAGITRREP